MEEMAKEAVRFHPLFRSVVPSVLKKALSRKK
jgi:hypothetical protein